MRTVILKENKKKTLFEREYVARNGKECGKIAPCVKNKTEESAAHISI